MIVNTESGYYPPGAEFEPNAPWKEKNLPEREIEVCVSVTLSKTVKINVTDYTIKDMGIDEDNLYFEDLDFSSCDLKSAVKNQITLPFDTYTDWNVDEFEVVLE